MANYQVIDAYGSVITVNSSIISAGVQRPIVDIGNLGASSVSGTVGASIIGLTPVTFTGAPSISGAVTVVGNPSISGQVGASIIGLTPVNVTNANINVSGSVVAFTSGLQGASVSGTVGASIIGLPPVNVTNTNLNVSGSVISFPASISPGSVVTFQGTNPWVIGSIVGTYAEDAAHTTADKGLFILGVRNDTVASFASANTEYSPVGVDNAGRPITKPFAPEDAAVRGMASTVGTSVTALLAAAGTGLRNYITDLIAVNSGSATAVVNIRDGDASILTRIIVPTGGGSNIPGLMTPLRTGGLNQQVDMVPLTASSLITITALGYKAP